ncbi:hypothetical protein FO519_001029 [Halicephalobus sp. NKZ332]|nr:hypothetical protein FO519_001029 [Halicephalobus sp. NKZ332]
MENGEAAAITGVFAPVEVTLPSLQHKHPVVVYDSKRFPGRSSEWFFHKLNRVSGFMVYRCVRCKSVNEKSKRSGAGSIGVPARIYIQNDHFMNDPDFPYGEHICQFETNPECESSSVYAKRAILEANKDMRQNPERPMAKYVKMLTLFEDDSGKYGHLDAETKKRAQTILNQVGNGFNARKRGLMLNYQLGKRQKVTAQASQAEASQPEDIKTDVGQEDEVDVEGTGGTNSPDATNIQTTAETKSEFYCGGPDCVRKFKSIASRTRHRKTLEAQQAGHPLLSGSSIPPLPFAVKWQQPLEGEFGNFGSDEATTAVFQTNVNDLLNALHNVSYYLPQDPAVQNEFCEDLQNMLQKYIPLQQQGGTLAVDEVEE